jgi:hypothetical protein
VESNKLSAQLAERKGCEANLSNQRKMVSFRIATPTTGRLGVQPKQGANLNRVCEGMTEILPLAPFIGVTDIREE